MNTIGLDLGTGAIKGICWNPVRGVLKSASERICLRQPRPGWAELDPREHLAQVLRILRILAGASDSPIGAIAFAAAAGNTLLCAPDGTPRTPIISWLDHRLDWQPPPAWNVRQVCGWPALPAFPLMHLEFFRREVPALLDASHVAMNNDWLAWMLTGCHALDFSNGAPFYLIDQRSLRYHPPFLAHFGLDETRLPALLPSGTTIATLKPEYTDGNLTAATRLVAGSFDHPAAARAAAVTRPGDLLLSCGTSWVGFYPVPRRDDIPEHDELCDTFLAPDGGCWGAMFSVTGIGVEVEDFITAHFGTVPDRYRAFNDEARLDSSPSRCKMREVVTRFKQALDRHPPFHKVIVSGGPSEGETWPAVIEEVLRLPVELSPYRSHTGAVGAAMLAAAPCP